MLFYYPVCHRGRKDCQPIHCVPSAPQNTSEDDLMSFNFTPLSFVCSGCIVKREDRVIDQDVYRLCFKNKDSDEMSDNDIQDLTSIASVVSFALNSDAVRKVASGSLEIPTEQSKK